MIETLAQRLRRLRQEIGLSQEEVARRSGVPVSTLRALEHGRRLSPTLDTAGRLADALGIRLDDLRTR